MTLRESVHLTQGFDSPFTLHSDMININRSQKLAER